MTIHKLTDAHKLYAIGMRTAALSLRRIAFHMRFAYSVISMSFKRNRDCLTVDEHERSGRPRTTSASLS